MAQGVIECAFSGMHRGMRHSLIPLPAIWIACCVWVLGCADGLGTADGAGGSGGLVGTGGAGAGDGVGGTPATTGGAVGSGGVPGAGGLPVATGGAESGGAVGSGGASGGAPGGAGGGGGSGGEPPLPGPYFPAPGSTAQCPDASIRLRFDAPPTLGSSGVVQVRDVANPGSPVASVNMAQAQVSVIVGGSSFNQPRLAFVDGNEAIFVLPAALEYGHSYFVTIDAGVLKDPEGQDVVFDDPEEWTFMVAAAPPADRGALRVALDGTGQFCSVQGAIDAAQTGTTIELEPGAYYGIVYFKNKDGISLIGADRDTTRILGINNNNLNPSTRGRALFGTEDLSELLVESVTIQNLTPQDGSQAEALTLLSCDRCIVRDATMRSLQDTLLWSGRVYAEDSLIVGNVDYIWGNGTAYFNRVEVKTVGRKGYNIQARNTNANYGYVFVDSKLTADAGITGDVLARIDVSAYPYSHVAYVDCELGPHISAAGWTITGGGSTANLRFWEYKSRTPGGDLVDTSGRASGSRQLNESEAEQMRDAGVVLGGWDPR